MSGKSNSGAPREIEAPRNIIILLTDQERAHDIGFGPEFDASLPATSWLKENGLSFSNAFANTNQCSASRSTFFTSQFPAQHQVREVITSDNWLNPQTQAQNGLDPAIPNLATILKSEGYDVVYKGKAHLNIGFNMTKGTADPSDDEYIDPDLALLGFDEWDPPEAGTYKNPLGINNDQRFIDDAVAWIQDRASGANKKPFALIVSQVNPHDIIAYPSLGQALSVGYTLDDFTAENQPLPPTYSENLISNYKPTAQAEFLRVMSDLFPPVDGPAQVNAYLNFYKNLVIRADNQQKQIIDALLKYPEFAADTLIVRTSDHGELGLAHGGMRQKTFNAYDEALKVPLTWANSGTFFDKYKTKSVGDIVTHIDFLPTYLNLIGVDEAKISSLDLKGHDYSGLLRGKKARQWKNELLFTWDDDWAGQDPPSGTAKDPQLGLINPPSKIHCLRTRNFKLVRYYDPSKPYYKQVFQEEFYDLRPNGRDYSAANKHPLELINYSPWANRLRKLNGERPLGTTKIKAAYKRLSKRLNQLVEQKLQPLPKFAGEKPSIATRLLEDGTREEVFYLHDGPSGSKELEIAFNSRSGQFYNIQFLSTYESDGQKYKVWTTLNGGAIKGTSNPIYSYFKGLPADATKSDFRIAWVGSGQSDGVNDDYSTVLKGTSQDDRLFTSFGEFGAARVNTLILGLDGNDQLYAGSGNDGVVGGRGNDLMGGGVGNDQLNGGDGDDDVKGDYGNDFIHGGNGDDQISGGFGSDELHGDFGFNVFASERDGAKDLLVIASDQFLFDPLRGKAGNSPNGELADIIKGLDPDDDIIISGVSKSELEFDSNITHRGDKGIGVFARGAQAEIYR
jgi:arylsulfatase A-like enzyme